MMMRRTPSKILLVGITSFILILLMSSYNTTTTSAQIPLSDAEFVNDGTLWVYASLDEKNMKTSGIGNPIEINMVAPMELYLQINVTSTQNLNMSGKITFFYQDIAIYPIQIVDYVTNSSWVYIDHLSSPEPVRASIDLASAFNYGPVKLMTGIFDASIEFSYYNESHPNILHTISNHFFFSIPATPLDVITSITGISASVATVGAVVGVGRGFMSLFEGLKTAYKLRGIHKKASELRSLPNLTVIGALPLLFSMLAGMTKMGKKKKIDQTKEETQEESKVSEYIVRQRLREVAPDAWSGDKCPKCKRDWNKKLNMCKKCNLTEEDARIEYADLLASKVPTALRVMGKKKSSDIRTLAKKTKSTDYNAGVIAAAMVDTNVTEIVKVGTPFRSFVLNIAGLAFLVITWQQLLGDSTSTMQTTLTVVGAAMSLAVIIALYVSRKAQIHKFQADIEAGKKWMPTEAEVAAETAKEDEESKRVDTSEEEAIKEEPEATPVEDTESKEDSEDAIDESGSAGDAEEVSDEDKHIEED